MNSREQKLKSRFSKTIVAKKIVNEVTDVFGGGAEKKAGKQAAAELTRGREAVSRLAEQSRGTLYDLFADAQTSRRGGLQGALDVFSESIPLQAQLTQGGNVAAQRALLAGLPQIQNAIFGFPVDMSALQPTQLPFEMSFTNMQLPTAPDIARPPAETAETVTGAANVADMLAGGGGGSGLTARER